MSYLERLKNLKGANPHPTKTTKTPEKGVQPVFVVSVGCPPAHIGKTRHGMEASNDPGPPPHEKRKGPGTHPTKPTKTPTPTRPTIPDAASPEWRALDVAYQAHHFRCPVCVAAGLGYGLRCGAGAALWRAYAEYQPGSPALD
jgi:hypothetical protein